MSQTTYKETLKNSKCFVFLSDLKLTDAKGIEWSQLSLVVIYSPWVYKENYLRTNYQELRINFFFSKT
jgi:hypothetical protein